MILAIPGWTPELAARCVTRPPHELGRVIEQNRHHYLVATSMGIVDASIAGRLLFKSNSLSELPSVGDWVEITRKPSKSRSVIQRIFPRTSKLSRKVVGKRSDEQILVANVDQALVVQSADDTFNVRRVERFAVVAKESAREVGIVLSKIDLVDDPSPMIEALQGACPGMPIFQCSIDTQIGTDSIRQWIKPSHTVVVIGPSGVGKSTLINQLCRNDQQKTQAVNERHFKGTHTTTKRQLIEMADGGILIDTPGLRELQLWDADEGIQETFDDIAALTTSCRFSDCGHKKTLGCAVEAAVTTGKISPDRLDSYIKLQEETQKMATNLNRLKAQRNKRHLTQAKKGSNTHHQKHLVDDETAD